MREEKRSDTVWIIPQDWESYTAAEHSTWDQLFRRQTTLLPGRVVPEFLQGVDMLELAQPGIPNFKVLSERLHQLTGWQVVAVPGLVPEEIFFEQLAQRRFVAGRFIRSPGQIDYLEEPDIFHDVFGHVPLLAHPVFADYMQAYGEAGLKAMRHGAIHKLARLYWYTVEFGLIRSKMGLSIFGAGIVSSASESLYCLEDDSPNRLEFNLPRVLQTEYRIDDHQQTYFVVDSFEKLLGETLHSDFGPLYERLSAAPDLRCDAIVSGDRIIHRGTQRYARMRQHSRADCDETKASENPHLAITSSK